MTVPVAAPDPSAAEPPTMGALSRLIWEAKEAGLSYQQLADRAIDPETGQPAVVKQYLQKLVRTPPASPPTPTQLKAIARAIRKSERRVKEAAAQQWLDYEVAELAGYDEEVRIIVGYLAGKPKAEVRRWRAMIEADERAQSED